MPQQINLLTPVLMVPKRYFSALALVQALGLVALGCVALIVWTGWQAHQARQGFAIEAERASKERRLLTQALAQHPAPTDPKLLAQDLASTQQQLAQLQAQLKALEAGRLTPGQAHSDLMQLLATRTPTSIWLQQIRRHQHGLLLEGSSTQAADLNPWLRSLSQHPLLQGQQLADIRVEARDGGIWSFAVRSSLSQADPLDDASARPAPMQSAGRGEAASSAAAKEPRP